jgi:phosphoenolpyruvate synthase/pyruvate phosphate dikinase
MDSDLGWVISLEQGAAGNERMVGGKAAKLAQLAGAGYRVPRGFCLTTLAYEHFLKQGIWQM